MTVRRPLSHASAGIPTLDRMVSLALKRLRLPLPGRAGLASGPGGIRSTPAGTRKSRTAFPVALALALVVAGALQRGLVALGVLHLDEASLGEARFSWIGALGTPALFVAGLLFLIAA